VLPMLTSRGVRNVGRGVAAALRQGRLAPTGDISVLASGFASLHDAGSRQAFLHTVRAVIDTGGQRVSANDRLHLAAVLPTLIVWGERDSIIPPRHGQAAHEAMPGSRLELFPGAGHMPHHQDPDRFAEILAGFCGDTAPAHLTADHWRPLLRE
jgi:pimeloyl-ACP methyl ester carboxylesterase